MSHTAPGSLGRGARGRILAAARRLFAANGIQATGIAELIAAARVSRRTLYAQFGSKDELVVAYLRDLADDPDELPQRVLDREDLTARARLLEVCGALGEGPRPLRGDPFLAAALQITDPGHAARHVIARRQTALTERLSALAREAGARDAERIGARLLVVYCGAAAATVAADDPGPAAEATVLTRALLAAAIDPDE